jgi:hypothetical protein
MSSYFGSAGEAASIFVDGAEQASSAMRRQRDAAREQAASITARVADSARRMRNSRSNDGSSTPPDGVRGRPTSAGSTDSTATSPSSSRAADRTADESGAASAPRGPSSTPAAIAADAAARAADAAAAARSAAGAVRVRARAKLQELFTGLERMMFDDGDDGIEGTSELDDEELLEMPAEELLALMQGAKQQRRSRDAALNALGHTAHADDDAKASSREVSASRGLDAMPTADGPRMSSHSVGSSRNDSCSSLGSVSSSGMRRSGSLAKVRRSPPLLTLSGRSLSRV